MKNRYSLKLALLVLAASAVWTAAAPQAEEPAATLSGEVRAAKPFQAAGVYIRNIDKHVLYMVYTESGRYEATKLLPGNYEVSVKKNGFTTDVQKVQAKAGAKLKADFSLTDGSFTPAQLALFNGPGPQPPQPLPVPYDELYPAGVGKAVVERTCVACHGPNFLPRRKWTEQSANAALDLMMNVSGGARGGGMITPAMMSPADRQAALAYITSNFGADKPVRSTKVQEYKGSLGHTPVVDSNQNVWFTVIVGNKIGKWDRAAEKGVALYEPPTKNSYPYGVFVDKNDKLWFAEFAGCNITKFDPVSQDFAEYSPLTKPCQIRRLGMDSKGIVWFGIYSHGKLGKLDPKTGKVTEYKIPLAFAQPYDAWPDHDDNIWMGDDGQGGTLIRFDPRTEKFTYYPAPQMGDMPKLAITREGAIWYTPRSSANAAAGVLYPDRSKLKTLGAYY
jgi:mono/diheme cytochrome c family protein